MSFHDDDENLSVAKDHLDAPQETYDVESEVSRANACNDMRKY
jgi:hypothetical protein